MSNIVFIYLYFIEYYIIFVMLHDIHLFSVGMFLYKKYKNIEQFEIIGTSRRKTRNTARCPCQIHKNKMKVKIKIKIKNFKKCKNIRAVSKVTAMTTSPNMVKILFRGTCWYFCK